MSVGSMLWIYCGLIFCASLSGGVMTSLVRITHRRMQLAISFVAGVMLGVGLLHMIPHSHAELHDIDATVGWVLIGVLVMFFLQRFFHFHHHDAPDDGEVDEVEHVHAHCDHEHHSAPTAHAFSWSGAFVGLALHSMVDGLALAAAVASEAKSEVVPLLAGIGTFLAIFLHKPFDSLSITTLMAAGGWPARARSWANVAYAAVLPCGVLLFCLGLNHTDHHAWLGRALAFAGGAFLCIATIDLLPEVQFHSHDRAKLSLALLLGIALAWSITLVETHGHEGHGHKGEAPMTKHQ